MVRVWGVVGKGGGVLGWDGVVGRGSTFWLLCGVPEVAGQGPSVVNFEGPAPARVLIIDDNETNRRVLLAFLSSWDVPGEAASGGTAGLGRLPADSRRLGLNLI